MTIDTAALDAFVGRFAHDLGAVMHAATVLIGDELGLYRAMADSSWTTADELASRTGTDPRYVAEWLAAQAASEYCDYDPATGAFRLTPEQSFALTDPDGPLFLPGGFQVAASTIKDAGKVADAFRTGAGLAWGEHHPDLFIGTERFFKPSYVANLVESWIPALEGVEQRLRDGALVADVGCGHGASTILLAQAYPASRLIGYEPHVASVDAARKAAADAGVADRCSFEVAAADAVPTSGFDLITLFDCLHDMGDPAGISAHLRAALAPAGTLMVVEPAAGDSVADNLNPVGRIFYSASTTICTPGSRSQEVGLALGAQAGAARLTDILTSAGFTRVREAARTPFNLVLEARP